MLAAGETDTRRYRVPIRPPGEVPMGISVLTNTALLSADGVATVGVSVEIEVFADIILTSSGDAFILPRQFNTNEGGNEFLALTSDGGRALVAFDLADLDLQRLARATLVLRIDDIEPPPRFGGSGGLWAAHPLIRDWAEGNGDAGEVGFVSREGAAGLGDPDLAPRLILELGP